MEGSTTLEEEDAMDVDEKGSDETAKAAAVQKAKPAKEKRGKKRELRDLASAVGKTAAESPKRSKPTREEVDDDDVPPIPGLVKRVVKKKVMRPRPGAEGEEEEVEIEHTTWERPDEPPGKEWINVYGHRYKVGEDGIRRRWIGVRALKKKYRMARSL